jgi:hypothetical protein
MSPRDLYEILHDRLPYALGAPPGEVGQPERPIPQTHPCDQRHRGVLGRRGKIRRSRGTSFHCLAHGLEPGVLLGCRFT